MDARTHRENFYSIILYNSSFPFFRELLFLNSLIPLSWYLSTYFSYFNSLYLLFIFLRYLFILGSLFLYFLQSKKLYFLNFKLRFNSYYFNCFFFFVVFHSPFICFFSRPFRIISISLYPKMLFLSSAFSLRLHTFALHSTLSSSLFIFPSSSSFA